MAYPHLGARRETSLDEFMVMCRFREGTVMSEVFAVVGEEQAAVAPENAEGEAQWTAKEQMAHLAEMETGYRAWVERGLADDGVDVTGVAGERPKIR